MTFCCSHLQVQIEDCDSKTFCMIRTNSIRGAMTSISRQLLSPKMPVYSRSIAYRFCFNPGSGTLPYCALSVYRSTQVSLRHGFCDVNTMAVMPPGSQTCLSSAISTAPTRYRYSTSAERTFTSVFCVRILQPHLATSSHTCHSRVGSGG
jgi:hypothetical protein